MPGKHKGGKGKGRGGGRRKAHVAMALALVLSGCALFDSQATPEERYHDALALYNGTVSTLIDLRVSGKISNEEWSVRINPMIQGGRQTLANIKTALDSGAPVSEIDVLRAALIQIVAQLERSITEVSTE